MVINSNKDIIIIKKKNAFFLLLMDENRVFTCGIVKTPIEQGRVELILPGS